MLITIFSGGILHLTIQILIWCPHNCPDTHQMNTGYPDHQWITGVEVQTAVRCGHRILTPFCPPIQTVVTFQDSFRSPARCQTASKQSSDIRTAVPTASRQPVDYLSDIWTLIGHLNTGWISAHQPNQMVSEHLAIYLHIYCTS